MNITSDTNIRSFLTNVGLITSNGPFGHNIMACEWTHQISYDPALIALAIRNHKATFQNIIQSKEFGVSIASVDQIILSSVAGNRSGKDVDKIKMLEELGFHFSPAKHIDALMVEGACMNAECQLVQTIDIGDHPLLIGEIISLREIDAEPVVYNQGKYWSKGERLSKPGEAVLTRIRKLHEKYKK
ncbi:flavin reductase family protein [Candidatus Roizmanbacteria bacterium]|nr:flavin reductase family protein [Candidatus Roizmanbacteria bacterium]